VRNRRCAVATAEVPVAEVSDEVIVVVVLARCSSCRRAGAMTCRVSEKARERRP
jgi:hypothetical protein